MPALSITVGSGLGPDEPRGLNPALMPMLDDMYRVCDDLMFHTVRNFLPDSSLQFYLALHYPHTVRYSEKNYILFDIVTAVKTAITDYKLFDPQNPEIIICDSLLEAVFECEAFHISELKVRIIRHFVPIPIPREPWLDPVGEHVHEYPKTSLPPWGSPDAIAIRAQALHDCTYFPPNGLYRPEPALRIVLREVDTVRQRGDVFTFQDILNLVTKYVNIKKESLIDSRSTRIVHVANDALGHALGVSVYARSQQRNLVQMQIRAVAPFPDRIRPSRPVLEPLIRAEAPVWDEIRPSRPDPGPVIYPPFIITLRDPNAAPELESVSSGSEEGEDDSDDDRDYPAYDHEQDDPDSAAETGGETDDESPRVVYNMHPLPL